jgi:hypothetical protein
VVQDGLPALPALLSFNGFAVELDAGETLAFEPGQGEMSFLRTIASDE